MQGSRKVMSLFVSALLVTVVFPVSASADEEINLLPGGSIRNSDGLIGLLVNHLLMKVQQDIGHMTPVKLTKSRLEKLQIVRNHGLLGPYFVTLRRQQINAVL